MTDATATAPPPVAPAPARDLFDLVEFLAELGHARGQAQAVGMAVGGFSAFLRKGGLRGLLTSFQAFHGLDQTGKLDDATAAKIHTPRCAHPDRMDATVACKWPNPQVTWSQTVELGGIPSDVIARTFIQAWRAWSDVCGLRPVQVSTAANVSARGGNGRSFGLDGPGGVLAWSEIPCGMPATAQLRQVFDQSETWDEAMLLGVVTHEIGHAIGLSHLTAGTLMNPYYTPGIVAPTPADVAEAVARYGPPLKTPAPAPAPVPAPVPVPIPGTGSVNVAVVVPEAGSYTITLSMAKNP